MKNKAKDDVFRSAASIVDEAMLSVIKPGDPEASVPAPGLLEACSIYHDPFLIAIQITDLPVLFTMI